jgi:hypothetical protein
MNRTSFAPVFANDPRARYRSAYSWAAMRVRMMSYGLGLAACCIIASSCGSHEGYAGLTKTQAMNAAEAEIAKNDYGGNRAYFHGSIWSDAVRRTRTRLEIGRG